MNQELNLSWDDFSKVDMRVGTIVEAKLFEQAKNPSYQVQIDFGPEIGLKKTSAQITTKYLPEELIGKQVIAVVNFPPKQIANFMSECLLLGAVDSKDVVLLSTDMSVKNGLKIS